jgi:hypothetical protein
MSSHQDPPRLRNMGAELPASLTAALTSDPAEFPQATQMSDLANRLAPLLKTATLAAAAAIPVGLMAPKAPLSLIGTLKLLTLKWGHTVILPMAIGAASGAVAWEAREYVAANNGSRPAVTKTAPVQKAVTSSRGKASKRESAVANDEMVAAEEGEESAAVGQPVEPQARVASALAPARVTAPSPASALEVPPAIAIADNVTEIELIDRAQRSLAHQPAVARQWVEEHMKRFPEGTFAQERETIAIEAFVGEGRLIEARTRAAQFRARFPESAYLRRIDAVLRSPKTREPN